MLIRIGSKLKEHRGSDKGIMLTGLIVLLFLIVYLIISRSNQILDYEVENFMEGLRLGSKAALLQISQDEENLENIATGYIIVEEDTQSGYNHQLKLNHRKSNNIALKMLSRQTGFSIKQLKNNFKTVIIEIDRQENSVDHYRLVSTFYNMDSGESSIKVSPYINFNNPTAIKNQFKEIEDWINSLLEAYNSDMNIKLTSIESGFSRNMEVKTYFLSIIDGFNPQERLSAFYDEQENKHKLINVYYFEGSNLMRSTDFRIKQ